jgi:hypothetical protein
VFVERHSFLPMIMLLDEYGMNCCVICHDGGEWHTVAILYLRLKELLSLTSSTLPCWDGMR